MPGRVFKRNDIYWIGFSYRGKEYRKSAKSAKKRDAENLLAFYLGQCARDEFKGFQQETSLTVGELLDDLIYDGKQRQLRDIATLTARVRVLRAGLGDMHAPDLTERQIDLYVKKRLSKGIAPATLNCEMAYLHQAYRLAVRKKLLEKIPHVPRFKVNNARQGFFEREDFERVVSFLPDYLKDFSRFGYLTGWRRKEITRLEWRDISEGVIRLRPEVSKNAEGRVLIVVGEIAEIVERRRAERVDLIPYVFHRNGQRISIFNKAWKRACTRAGVPGKLFHDLRRTAVRNMIRAGVPERIAMAISGHKTRSIFDRYNIVNEEDIRLGLLKTQEYVSRKVASIGQTTHS
jgi:integrase